MQEVTKLLLNAGYSQTRSLESNLAEFRNENRMIISFLPARDKILTVTVLADEVHFVLDKKESKERSAAVVAILDDKRTDIEFARKLKEVMQAVGSHHSDTLREPYDLKLGQGKIREQLFCGELYALNRVRERLKEVAIDRQKRPPVISIRPTSIRATGNRKGFFGRKDWMCS
jgi:hypothetical protein